MIELVHIIAVRRAPAEIRETTVPADQASAKVALMEKQFETVFVLRRFRGYAQDPRRG